MGASKFGLQVGGHGQGTLPGKAMLVEGSMVLKPLHDDGRGENEVRFYEYLNNQSNDDVISHQLKLFVPKYFGTKHIPGEHSVYLALECLTASFSQPNVLDAKLGRCTWGPNTPQEKRDRMRARYPQQQTIGFRIVGMKVFNPAIGCYDSYERAFGYSLTEDNVASALTTFLGRVPEQRRVTAQRLAEKLEKIKRWAQTQRRFMFYGTSVLLVYEGDQSAATADNVEVRLVDFAHTIRQQDAESQWDEGFAFGIDRILEFIAKAAQDTPV